MSDFPARFVDLKREIASSPNFEERLTASWVDLLGELKSVNESIAKEGSQYIPQVKFSDLNNLTEEQRDVIKRKGSVVIKDVVDDAQAAKWKADLEEFTKSHSEIPGIPAENKQFFLLYWTKPQVEARSHPNVLATSVWLNNLYHGTSDGADLSTPLTYADRFRIRHAGGHWPNHPPHIDGGSIERWEDETFRTCYAEILAGNWRKHDPYDLQGRLDARSSLYGRPNQSSIFRSFQGWLALSNTGPSHGTLRVFPGVLLSNAYIIMRPFFKPVANPSDLLDPKSWTFDISTAEFPGLIIHEGGFLGPRPTPDSHPHLELAKTMTSVPAVSPGDMVFWHCDVIHAVEEEHIGAEDSAVMYIPAVPHTSQNFEYVQKQKEHFLLGTAPPDFPKGTGAESVFGTIGTSKDFLDPLGMRAMGFQTEVM